ncbi:MAG: P-loop NTPase fold protein [Novosphingobium sp.]
MEQQMPDSDETPEMIWKDDLFNRKDEAISLIAYLESVAGRPTQREDRKAYTVAVDAGYGEGKSFFLKRLARHIGLDHPVAFVDAWADDLANEPLTALAATLEDALRPFIGRPEVKAKLKSFLLTTGRVAKIVSLGLLRRGVGLVITGKAVDAAEELIAGASDAMKEAVDDGLADVSKGIADDAANELKAVSSNSMMEQRIAEFRDGQAAIRDMKASLTAIVESIEGGGREPPIFILIDELDRCRPTYAIKLLEEIKHLFDVPGLVFIFAMNADQLGHSVCGAYGAGFDGRAYLRRFIDREYRLAEADLEPLLLQLCKQAHLEDHRFTSMDLGFVGGDRRNTYLSKSLAIYMKNYGLSARDAFLLVDVLQTCDAIALNNNRLWINYLLPLIIEHLKGLPKGHLPKSVSTNRWVCFNHNIILREWEEFSLDQVAVNFRSATKLTDNELNDENERQGQNIFAHAVLSTRAWNSQIQPIWAIERYPDLIQTVARFKNPQLES